MKSETSIYTGFEFEADGFPAIAIINTNLKDLPDKAAYPYSVFILLEPDRYDETGHPTEEEFEQLNEIEKQIIAYLEEQTATLHVGHVTLYRAREIIFYTKDREQVESFLEYFLSTVEKVNELEIISDPEWENVAAFYENL